MAEEKRNKENEIALAFDQYQRYRLVGELIVEICAQGKPAPERISVLDLGGVQGFLRRFLPGEACITTANIEQSEHDRQGGEGDSYVLIGEGALPFADGEFDIGVACDVLEHVPPDKRAELIAELGRVSRRAVIMTGPFATEGVREAEESIERLYEKIHGRPFRWLQEHAEYGLPELGEVERQFGEIFSSYEVISSSYLPLWRMLMAANVALDGAAAAELNRELTDIYAKFWYEADYLAPGYRHTIVGIKEGPKPKPPKSRVRGEAELLKDPNALFMLATLAIGALAEERAAVTALTEKKGSIERELEQMREARSRSEAVLKERNEILRLTEKALKQHKAQLAQRSEELRLTQDQLRQHAEYIERIRRTLPFRLLRKVKRLAKWLLRR